MARVRIQGKYQVLYESNIDYNAIEEQVFKPGSGVGVFMEKNATIKIQLDNPRHSPILIFPNGKVQITVISEEEEAEVLDKLRNVLVPLEGDQLHFEEVKRPCSLKDTWPIYQRIKQGECVPQSGLRILVSQPSFMNTNWMPPPGKQIYIPASAGNFVVSSITTSR